MAETATWIPEKMKLEAVDKRNPLFIRVATVADTDDHRIKVSVLDPALVWTVVTLYLK